MKHFQNISRYQNIDAITVEQALIFLPVSLQRIITKVDIHNSDICFIYPLLAEQIPWDVFESKYEDLFPNDTGNVAKPLRTALGSLIIQKKFCFSGRELVEQITENPYLQYFIGLPSYQEEPPFDASTLVLFRKRLSPEIITPAHRPTSDIPKTLL